MTTGMDRRGGPRGPAIGLAERRLTDNDVNKATEVSKWYQTGTSAGLVWSRPQNRLGQVDNPWGRSHAEPDVAGRSDAVGELFTTLSG